MSHRPTAAQIAKQLRLSRTTVSLVLNGRSEAYRIPAKTRERVLQAAQRLDYHPSIIARQLAGKRSNAFGVLINTAAVADTRLIQMMEVLAAERGVRFIVGHALCTRERVREYLQDFRSRGVDGIISIFHNHPDYREIVLPELSRLKNVLFYERPERTNGTDDPPCCVEPDFYEVGRLSVQHLIERGRKRIGAVFNNLAHSYAVHRDRAHREVLAAAGRPMDERLVWVMDRQQAVEWTDAFTPELALRAVDELVIEKGADGVLAVNDLYAARVVAALRQRGRRVPEDVGVVGCDDVEIGTLVDPPLTTVNLQIEELARAMVAMMFEMLDTGSVPPDRRSVVIRPKLVVRQST